MGAQHRGVDLAGAHGPASSDCDVGPAKAAGLQPLGSVRPSGREVSRGPQAGVGIVSAESVHEALLRPRSLSEAVPRQLSQLLLML